MISPFVTDCLWLVVGRKIVVSQQHETWGAGLLQVDGLMRLREESQKASGEHSCFWFVAGPVFAGRLRSLRRDANTCVKPVKQFTASGTSFTPMPCDSAIGKQRAATES